MPYRLRSVLSGHELDVRSVAASSYPTGSILTASRDQQCKLWIPAEDSVDFVESHIFCGHSKYVACVCAMPPSDLHPRGLVITGGHDNLILVFDFNSHEPIEKLSGHQGTVCALSVGKFGTLLSGSWDTTARVWINGKTVLELKGHDAAIWAVLMMPDQGLMLTGSADKTVKLWKAGKCDHTFTGHTDCVRGLALLSGAEFLSCANDCVVRRWLVTGECLQVYEGHTNYIYSIAAIPNSDAMFVTCGEDRTVRIWRADGECEQVIVMPCQSVWSVAALESGDIIVGSSDNMCRVFSATRERQADDARQKEFDDEVANQAIPAAANLDLGEIKIDQLPGPEALLRPGNKKEQTKLIRRNGIVEAHQWDEVNGRWQKIGDVTGAAGDDGSKRKDRKTTYKGKEYDFVFNVELQEGVPPLKLPFNLTDDPYLAAYTFLQENELDPVFLDQVANFIIQNTKGLTIGEPVSTAYSDPFTGANRYIPSAATVQPPPAPASFGADPFTGSHQYVPDAVPVKSIGQPSSVRHIPEVTFVKFISGKSPPIIGKLKEFNSHVVQELRLLDEDVKVLSDSLDKLFEGNFHLDDSVLQRILDCTSKLQQWPSDVIFPALDILRTMICQADIGDVFFSEEKSAILMEKLLTLARESQPVANGLLTFRLFANSFSHHRGVQAVLKYKEKILQCGTDLFEMNNKNLNIAVSSCLLNYCVYCRSLHASFEERVQLCSVLNTLLRLPCDSESLYRLLVALGTLIFEQQDVIAFAVTIELGDLLKKFLLSHDENDKVHGCAKEILELLS